MPISPIDLKAILQAERSAALSTTSAELAKERIAAMNYYLSDMETDMPALDGRSKAVSSDVSDTVEGLMPGLMEIFAASEEVIRFDPVGPEDEDAAAQETDYVNHVFMQKNPGFLVLYSFIKDALLSKVGVVKIFWDTGERRERETYLDQPDDAFAALIANPDVEVLEHTPHEGQEGQEPTHDVTVVTRKGYGCAKVEPVPPEEFGISRQAKSIRDATYCYHERTNRTEADLIADGFDADQVRKLPTMGVATRLSEEKFARDTVEEEEMRGDTMNKATRPLRVTEHYVMLDYDGDDQPSLYRVTTGGDDLQVLRRNGKEDVVPVDEMPFAAMTPVIMTHRFFGRSIADLVMDIQRIKTALLRALLDNTYLLNNQRIEIPESHCGERTLDDLLVNRPGGIVRTKLPDGLKPIENQSLGGAILPVIEYVDATREWRTGVTRQGQGIDANALQNQSATAVNQAFTAAQARQKLIARIFAETGIRDMFRLLHGCIRKNGGKADTVRLRNKWVQVNPRTFKTRDDMTINVGLGTGSKAEQVSHLMMILGLQKEAIMMPALGLVTPKNLYNTASKLIEKIDLKTVEPYFTDPEAPDPQTGQPKQPPPQPPDPKVMQIQMQAQLDEKADQRKAQIEQVQAQADIATNQQKLQAEAANSERDYQLKAQLAMLTAQFEQQKFEREEARKDREHQQKMDLARESHHAQMQSAEFGMMAGQQAHEQKMQQAKSAGAKAE